jgi:transposase
VKFHQSANTGSTREGPEIDNERKEVVKELTNEGMSQREVAEAVGVDHSTVHKDLKAGEKSPNKADSAAESGEKSPSESEPVKPERERSDGRYGAGQPKKELSDKSDNTLPTAKEQIKRSSSRQRAMIAALAWVSEHPGAEKPKPGRPKNDTIVSLSLREAAKQTGVSSATVLRAFDVIEQRNEDDAELVALRRWRKIFAPGSRN